MPDSTTAPQRARATAAILQAQRLGQVVWGSLAAITVSGTYSAISGDWLTTGVFAVFGLLLLLSVPAVRAGNYERAGLQILVTLTLGVSGLIYCSMGLRDEAVLAIPGLLLLASAFARPAYFLGTAAALALVLLVVAIGNEQGWHVSEYEPGGYAVLFNLLGILGVSGYFIWHMSNELRLALARLEAENENIRRSHARIDALAHHDALTGLPNRLLARDRLEQAVALARRASGAVALLFLDLDNFKAVNDSLGHAAGDRLLCEVAARLREVLRASDTVSRLGGDEFLVVIGGVEDKESIAAAALKIIGRLSEPFQVDATEISPTCSVGIAVYPADGEDFDTLLRHADLAMYRAKDTGRNAFRFYDAELNSNVVDTLRLLAGIRGALARGEFQLHYQPQFELASGRIVGAEALIRWAHPELGNVAPARFIPVAERSGLINEVGRWVLREACRQARRWQDEGLAGLTVAVNLSAVQLRRDDFEAEVMAALAEAGLAPGCIELELTESLLIAESQSLGALLGRLRAAGLRLAIDDFGTGYSNLGYLQRFNVERLKIDQSFIRRLLQGASDESIVRAIIEMSHSLQMRVVAEGIEDAPTLQRLVELGCDFGQGYHWAPALPAPQFVAYLREQAGAAAKAAS
jgi:diguanylate cyclase (GGDEF)-like protein